MANQKYTGMKILRTAVVTGTVNAAIPSTILATTASQFSNVGEYPIDVTLGITNYTVVSTNGILT
jgi:hypothetical protein